MVLRNLKSSTEAVFRGIHDNRNADLKHLSAWTAEDPMAQLPNLLSTTEKDFLSDSTARNTRTEEVRTPGLPKIK